MEASLPIALPERLEDRGGVGGGLVDDRRERGREQPGRDGARRPRQRIDVFSRQTSPNELESTGPAVARPGRPASEARALVAHRLQAEHDRDEHGRERERDEQRRQVVLDVGAGELPVPDRREPARPRRRDVQQVVGRRARGVADAAQQVRDEDERDRDAVRAARGAEQLGGEEAEREEREARDHDRRAPDERSGGVEAVGDQGECDEQAESDVGQHAVHDRRGRGQDPSCRRRGDRLGASLFLLLHACGAPRGTCSSGRP